MMAARHEAFFLETHAMADIQFVPIPDQEARFPVAPRYYAERCREADIVIALSGIARSRSATFTHENILATAPQYVEANTVGREGRRRRVSGEGVCHYFAFPAAAVEVGILVGTSLPVVRIDGLTLPLHGPAWNEGLDWIFALDQVSRGPAELGRERLLRLADASSGVGEASPLSRELALRDASRCTRQAKEGGREEPLAWRSRAVRERPGRRGPGYHWLWNTNRGIVRPF